MPQNHFTWYELMTTDTAAAKAFYGEVVGWGSQDASAPGTAYSLFTAAGVPVSGLMDQPEGAREAGAPPSWLGYVGVGDVDAVAEQVQRLGGGLHVPPKEIPGVGRLAVVADPQGAAFALFKWQGPRQSQPADPDASGHIGWHELLAADWEAVFAFYSELFGWQKAEAVELGPMGIYQLFSVDGRPIGGMFTKPPAVPAPCWLYYFRVGGIDAAAERVKAGGGQIVNGPMEVPGGDWIVQGLDPQGALFALLGKTE